MDIIDCRGLACPQPVINTKKYFTSIEKGKAEILVDNEIAKNNVLKLASSNGLKSSVIEENGIFKIQLEKNGEAEEKNNNKNNFIVLLGSDKFGSGDDKLGTTLMKSYLYALSESDKLPTHLLMVNGGVKLAIEGEETVESLNTLKEKGVEILCCGTCLDFYGLKDKFAIGEITNMYTIVEVMNNASNTIKL